MMKGVSKKTKEKLARAGITLVKDIKYLGNSDDTIAEICRETHDKKEKNGLTFLFFCELLQQARDASDDPPPVTTDHHLASNPYKSMYGERWEEEIKKMARMKHFAQNMNK
eukprot:14618767-Ditylum_brightwellii.AAC.1